jgi:hypothetical protein
MLSEGWEAKLHETGKRLEVSEMGTARNAILQKWKRRGKCRIYIKKIYIYIYIKHIILQEKHNDTHK